MAKKLKVATALRTVPASIAGGVEILTGTTVEYTKIVSRFGEHRIMLADGKLLPAIFFDV
jgi:hypothetical protein